jgi:hypothetical protein
MYQSFVEIEGISFQVSRSQGGPGWKYCAQCGAHIPLSACTIIQRCNSLAALIESHVYPTETPTSWPRYTARIGVPAVAQSFVNDDTCVYVLIAASQNERMERFLAGTDNAMYDLVNELRYNPSFIGGPVRAVQAHFIASSSAAAQEAPK